MGRTLPCAVNQLHEIRYGAAPVGMHRGGSAAVKRPWAPSSSAGPKIPFPSQQTACCGRRARCHLASSTCISAGNTIPDGPSCFNVSTWLGSSCTMIT